MGAPAISSRGAAAPATPTKRPQQRRRAQAKPRARSNAPARRVSTPSKAVRPKSAARSASASTARSRPKASATARRSRITPPGGIVMFPAAAVGGAAGAVGGMANSGLVVGISRSRAWIVVLGILLGGIVALNVWGLSLSASTSTMAAEIDELQRTNSVLETRIAQRLSSGRVQKAAAAVGLDAPAAAAVRYVKVSSSDAERAAERLSAGDISILSALPIAPELAEAAEAPIVPEPAVVAPAIDPATGLPIDPATGLPADPAATAPAPVEPAPVAPAPVTTEPAAAPPPDPATSGAVGAAGAP